MKYASVYNATLDLFATQDAASLLDRLDEWVEFDWLHHLDSAFTRFLFRLDPACSAEVLLAAALLTHLEGRGHSCLLLDTLASDPQALLNWPEEAAAALQATMATLRTDWVSALRASKLVTHSTLVRAKQSEKTPLVLDQTRLYLRRYWQYEEGVAQGIRARTVAAPFAGVDPCRHWLDILFPSQNSAIDWQKMACAVALQSKLAIITGGPGTGKTYTVARLLALLCATAPDVARLRIALAAPTGKAAARLKQSIDAAIADLSHKLGDDLPLQVLAERIGAARTLHSLLGARPDTRRFAHNAANPLEVDVLIVDEASMIHLEMMDALLDALPSSARLILLGDKDQLASVEAGAVLGDLCRDAEAGHYTAATCTALLARTGCEIPAAYRQEQGSALAQQTVMLRASRRFGGPIGELASAVNRGDAAVALALLQAAENPMLAWPTHIGAHTIVDLARAGRAGAEGGYRPYLELLAQQPSGKDVALYEAWVRSVLQAFERFRVLCALREGEWGVMGINRAIESAFNAEGLISKNGEWYRGRPVMVTRNDPAAKVFNGDIGIALPAPERGQGMRVYFLEGDKVRSVLASRLADVETAYAMTVHKSQGSEFAHTVLVLPTHTNRVLTRELVYTGITRAREHFTLIAAHAQVLQSAIASRTQRASGLAEKLG